MVSDAGAAPAVYALWAVGLAAAALLAQESVDAGTSLQPISHTLRLLPKGWAFALMGLALSVVVLLAPLSSLYGRDQYRGVAAAALIVVGVVAVAVAPMPSRGEKCFSAKATRHYVAASVVLVGLVLACSTSPAAVAIALAFSALAIAAVAGGYAGMSSKKNSCMGVLVLVGEIGLAVTSSIAVTAYATSVAPRVRSP